MKFFLKVTIAKRRISSTPMLLLFVVMVVMVVVGRKEGLLKSRFGFSHIAINRVKEMYRSERNVD